MHCLVEKQRILLALQVAFRSQLWVQILNDTGYLQIFHKFDFIQVVQFPLTQQLSLLVHKHAPEAHPTSCLDGFRIWWPADGIPLGAVGRLYQEMHHMVEVLDQTLVRYCMAQIFETLFGTTQKSNACFRNYF